MLGLYYSNGFLGRVAYGAQARVMDGTLGRANCLVITMLMERLQFVMVPIGFQLASLFPPATYATLFALVWLSYIVGDGSSEIVGQLFGRQKLRVWGVGEVNRKSVAGTWACFLGSLGICSGSSTRLASARVGGVGARHLGLEHPLRAVLAARDDDLATANALLCWAFGTWAR